MNNYEIGSNDKLVIYGYSWGGDNAVELAQKLEKYGLKINDLITVDGSIGPLSGKFGSSTDFVDREIPSNVLRFSNFYQTNSGRIPFSQGGVNTGVSKSTIPFNIKYSGSSVNHYSIDDITKLSILNYLKR
jgi:pimeloyl-ACP methyl ester carboxylesterase